MSLCGGAGRIGSIARRRSVPIRVAGTPGRPIPSDGGSHNPRMATPIRSILAAVFLVIAACDPPSSSISGESIVVGGPVPRAVAERAPLPACGIESASTQNGPWNLAARRCFLDAYQAGRAAELLVTRLTIEGDPIRTLFRILGPGRVEVFIDSTRDAWSAKTWEQYGCRSLVVVLDGSPQPDFSVDDTCTATTLR
jgi:hypothetical protein